MSLSIPFPLGWLLNKKAARVEVNISLAFLHWVGIALHPWPFVSDIAIFVLKGDIKLSTKSLTPQSTASQIYNLRHRGHSLQLPSHTTRLSDSNFITRMLYKDKY